jgi:hypothetical protein
MKEYNCCCEGNLVAPEGFKILHTNEFCKKERKRKISLVRELVGLEKVENFVIQALP